MPMKGPKGAEPTQRGWINPKTGELLKSQKMTQAQIDEWHGLTPYVFDEAIANDITEGKIQAAMAQHEADDLEAKTKLELEELGREHGIELDRRKNKASLIDTLRNVLPK